MWPASLQQLSFRQRLQGSCACGRRLCSSCHLGVTQTSPSLELCDQPCCRHYHSDFAATNAVSVYTGGLLAWVFCSGNPSPDVCGRLP